MDFGFTDEQNAIKETAREMLAKRLPLSAVREAAESRTYPDALWKEIRDLGWPGIAIDEEHGGQGLGMVELVILSEELGYACAPTPFLSNAIAGLVIDAAGSDEQRDRWLPGIAQRAMELAVDYAKERQQFGRPIGAYQAVSHRCAGMLYDTEEARSLTYYAAWCADAEPESLPMAASMAKARASDAAWRVTADALQVFGGIGFTWEHDLHFLLKRAKVDAELLGDPRLHRERVATLAGLG